MGFANTRAALAVYDAGQAERDAAFERATTEVEISECVIAEVIAEEKVQDAYYQDTGAINSREHCRFMKIDEKLRALVSGETLDLSCGHSVPAPKAGDCATGYATAEGGLKICYECANAREREAMKSATRFAAYLHGAEGTITDWPGLKLAQLEGHISKRKMYTPSGGSYELWTFHARDLDGGLWACRGRGLGMLVHMRRMKDGAK